MNKALHIFHKLASWYFSKKALPYWAVLIMDTLITIFSLLVAYCIKNDVSTALSHFGLLLFTVCVYTLCYIVAFRIYHTYCGIIRYSSFSDLMRITTAMIVGSILVLLVRWILNTDDILLTMSWKTLLTGSAIATLIMGLMRIVVKITFEMRSLYEKNTHIMIFGTKEGGVSLAKSIRSQTSSPYIIEGFITHLPDMIGRRLFNLPIIGSTDAGLWDFIHNHEVKSILISPLAQDHFLNDCQAMIDRFIEEGIKIKMIPAEQDWDGKTNIIASNLRDVRAEDLLPRKKIEVDLKTISEMLKDKCILITGAAGSIGFEMVRQIVKFNPQKLILVDQAETPMHDVRLFVSRNYPELRAITVVTSICNTTHMETLFAEHKPEYVFHAAAYKHVPMMEDNPAIAIQNNVYGTRVIADLAVKYGTKKFVMISTDKAVNPTNVMGCSKRICEIYCQALNANQNTTQFVTTRFGNVLGSNGSVIPLFKQQIEAGGPVTVTHKDIIRYFMLIPEACRLVLEAGTMGHGGEIYVFDMGAPVRIADLAQRMIDLMNAKTVKIEYTGLRDGEKLYEEVLSNDEHTKPTCHPKIRVASVREYSFDLALKNERELYDLSFSYDDMAIVRKMKEIVPEYKSKHSKYECLDNQE